MTINKENNVEFESGDMVEPGEYLDLVTGAIIHVRERDELPTGHVEIEYRRRFKKLDSFTCKRIAESGA